GRPIWDSSESWKVSKLCLIGSLYRHHIDLWLPVSTGGLKGDFPTVARKSRMGVPSRRVREPLDMRTVSISNIDSDVSVAIRHKHDLLAVWGPRWKVLIRI